MSRVRLITALCAAFFALHPTTSFADEEPAGAPSPATKPAFGDAGQFALSLNQGFAVNQADLLDGSGIQANVFVTKHLSLGLAGSVQWLSTSSVASLPGSSSFLMHLGPRVGYDVPFSEAVSFWPQVGVDYRMLQSGGSSSSTVEGVTTSSSSSTTQSAFGLSVFAPIVVHPSRGFFVGAGPTFYTEFSNSTSSSASAGTGESLPSSDNPKITSIGLMAMIGGAI